MPSNPLSSPRRREAPSLTWGWTGPTAPLRPAGWRRAASKRPRDRWQLPRQLHLVIICTLLIVGEGTRAAAAVPSSAELATAEQAMRDVAKLVKDGRLPEAADRLAQLEKTWQSWQPPQERRSRFRMDALRKAIDKAKDGLAQRGVEVASPPNVERPERGPAHQSPPAATPPDSAVGQEFRTKIAPLIADHCLDCHGGGERRGGLSLETLADWKRGGDRGTLWQNGKSADSLLMGKLRGTADGQRMPLDGEPWSAEQLALIAKWIDAGSPADGLAEDKSLAAVANELRLLNATADEINRARKSQAEMNWQLAFPTQAFATVETDHYLIVADGTADRLQKLGQAAEAQRLEIERLLRMEGETGRPRVTLFIVNRLFDLNEFALMVEDRTLSRPLDESFWTISGIDAYAVSLVSANHQESASPWARSLTGLEFATLGELPDWFVRGLADAVAVKLAPEQTRAKRIAVQLANVRQVLASPQDFIAGKTSIGWADVAGCSFIQYLMREPRHFNRLIHELRGGQSLDASFQTAFGRGRDDLLEAWWQALSAPTPTRRR